MSIAVKEKKRPVRNLQKSNPDAPVSPMVIEELQQDYRAGCYDHIFELTPEEIENSETIAEFAAKNSLMSFREGKLSEVNRARVKEEAIGLISYEDLKENKEAVGVKIIIENRSDTNDVPYLSAFFDRLPYGIINKNRTGVGATTLEINSERHSIIVMPTKNLAFSKVLNGSKTESGKFRCNYVGSKMEEVKYEMPSISEYLQDDEIEYKKFIVVADSLHKVIEAIGASVYNEYFFMLDEIDSYQSDSTFRHSMADTLDYYFEFDAVQRCMVTATMQEFSNPKFRENDPVIEIKYPPLPKRKAHLIHTDNPNELTKEIIEELCERTQDQIVVAYNKIQYIMEIIENLDEKYKPDCAVLCSEMSRPYVGDDYFRKMYGNKLPRRINFITCTYFTGIDIEDRFHLISVSNVEFQFTLLSPDKMTQIAGRCRNGLLSERIIYSTKEYGGAIKLPDGYKTYLLNYADAVHNYINGAAAIVLKFNKLVGRSFLRVQNEIETNSKIHYYKGNRISIVRRNILSDEYEPAYFNIDALYEVNKLRSQLYSSPEELCKELSETLDIIGGGFIQEYREYSEQQMLNDKKVAERIREIDEMSLDGVIEELREENDALRLDDFVIEKIRKEQNRKNQHFIDRFSKLYKYVPFDRLMEDLIYMASKNATEYRGYCNAVIFWALPENHPFKRGLKERFKEGAKYSSEYIRRNIDALYLYHFDKQINTKKHVQILGEYVATHKPSAHRDEIVIKSYNKLGFDFEPLTTISADQKLNELNLIEFSKTTK